MLLSEGLHHLFLEFCQGAFQMFSTLFHNHQGLLLFCLCRALLVFHFPFAHGCDHAQIFCVHGLIHAHRKSRVIGVLMAMCTSKPIIGKDATRVGARNKRLAEWVLGWVLGWVPETLACPKAEAWELGSGKVPDWTWTK